MANTDPALPERYEVGWRTPFNLAMQSAFRPGQLILDVGAGRTPAFKPEERPADSTYVGADILASELELAGSAYDETVVSDIRDFDPALERGFDVAMSFQVLEHIKPIAPAIENIRLYLKPGGVFVSQLSGGRAMFALLNRVVPPALAKEAMYRLLNRQKDSVFPATYDRCTKSGLEDVFSAWTDVQIEPRWIGAGYLRFAPPLQKLYLKYEDWAIKNNRVDLAPYYVITATR